MNAPVTPRWDHRKYGSASDPLRQSDLNALASQYACSKRFQFDKADAALGAVVARPFVSYKAALGTATHETIRAYLTKAPDRIVAGELPSPDAVRAVVDRELDLVVLKDGAHGIDWRGEDRATEVEDVVHMVLGALRIVAQVAEAIVLCEAPFRAEVEAPGGKRSYTTIGTVDLVYVPRGRPGEVGLLDWKTGEQRPERIILDHGYQLGVYANALERGVFFPGTNEERTIGLYPSELAIAHLRDAVPYQKAGSSTASRPELAEFYGVELGTKVKYERGNPRGPVLYRSARTPAEMGRLRASVDAIVGTVRLGRFVEYLSDSCSRCPHASRCLAAGFDLGEDEKAAVTDALGEVDKKHLDVLSDFAA